MASAIDVGVSGQRHAAAMRYARERAAGTHWIGGWEGLSAGLDTETRGKILLPCWGSNTARTICSQILH
jgi:hypothetical protein